MRKKILPCQKKCVILQPISETERKHKSAVNQREIGRRMAVHSMKSCTGPLAQLVRAADS